MDGLHRMLSKSLNTVRSFFEAEKKEDKATKRTSAAAGFEERDEAPQIFKLRLENAEMEKRLIEQKAKSDAEKAEMEKRLIEQKAKSDAEKAEMEKQWIEKGLGEPATWSEPVPFTMIKLDTSVVVSKAGDWGDMGTLACVGTKENRSAFDTRFSNTDSSADGQLAQNIKTNAVSVVNLPAGSELVCGGLGDTQLYIRNRYVPYITACVEKAFFDPRGRRFIVTAQPGIGKSNGVGNFIIHHFAQKLSGDASAIIVVRSATHFHIIRCGKITSLAAGVTNGITDAGSRLTVEKRLQAYSQEGVDKVLLVHDVKSSREKDTGAEPLFYNTAFESSLIHKFRANVTAVQLASPDGVNENVKNVQTLDFSTIVIPAWSYDELESLQVKTQKSVMIGGKKEPFFLFGYELFGGILRTRMVVLENDESVSKFRRRIEARKNKVGYFEFEKFATTSVLSQKVPSSIALIVPNEQFDDFARFLDFVSDAVMVFCKSTVQGEVERYWRNRMESAESASAKGAVLEAVVKSKLLLWRESESHASTDFPLKYQMLGDGKVIAETTHNIVLCPGPFVSIAMRISVSGAEFVKMPALCDAALSKGGGSVLVTFDSPTTPAIDFALLTRTSGSCAWQVYFLQCTVSSSHPFPTAAADVLEGLVADPKKAVLRAFIWVGRTNGTYVHGVSSPQGDNGSSTKKVKSQSKVRFEGKQAMESIGV